MQVKGVTWEKAKELYQRYKEPIDLGNDRLERADFERVCKAKRPSLTNEEIEILWSCVQPITNRHVALLPLQLTKMDEPSDESSETFSEFYERTRKEWDWFKTYRSDLLKA